MTEKKTAEEILLDTMTDAGFTYVSFPAFVENESSVDVFDISCRAMEAYAAQQPKMLPGSIAEGRVLMYGNIIVDSIMLPDGIYGTKLPRIYPPDETIEHMSETGKMFRDKTGTEWLPDSYFDNLAKCELREVAVVFSEQQSKMPKREECDKKMFEILSQPTSLGKDLRGVRSPAMMMAEYSEWLRNQIEK